MSAFETFFARLEARLVEERARGEHDDECEQSLREQFWICNCSKRARLAAGRTETPTEDLYFPPPSCPACDGDLECDGDGWDCTACHLSWDTGGSASSACWTDDHGDLSRCEPHGIRAHMFCEQACEIGGPR